MNLLELSRILHDIGIAWGVGGATIAAILTAKSEKNPDIAPSIMKIMPLVSKLIWAAIILLIISGIALTRLISWPINPTTLAVKHVLVVVLILNGVNLSFRVLPKMKKLAPQNGGPSEEFLKAKKTAKISGLAGLVLWYLILILSVIM